MKILFVWTGLTSYMADCWRRLHAAADVELKVVVDNVHSGRAFDAERLLGGLDYALVDGGKNYFEDVAAFLGGWTPDIVFAVGWRSPVVRRLVERADWRGVPKVCCFDMPWRWSLRCIAARWVLRPFLRRYAAAYVPGRICAKYAGWLGFPRVEKGLFSIDQSRFRAAAAAAEGTPRKGFLYVGRYSDEKRVDLIERAHELYRARGGTWPLDCYGQGGRFAQPDEMPRIYAEHACLVLASAFDPWPLVVLEAVTSGCEVIASDRCGNRFELPGMRVVRFGDVDAMARAMAEVEKEGGRRRRAEDDRTTDYDCETWAKRTLRIARDMVEKGGCTT